MQGEKDSVKEEFREEVLRGGITVFVFVTMIYEALNLKGKDREASK